MPVGALKLDEGIIYPCANCNSEYKSENQLKRHNYNVHTKIDIVCELCELMLKTKQQMNNHNTRC